MLTLKSIIKVGLYLPMLCHYRTVSEFTPVSYLSEIS